MSRFSHATTLITGASTGIGRELAKLIARDAPQVVLVARDQARLQSLAEEIGTIQGKRPPLVLPADLSLPQTPAHIASQLAERNIHVDCLVNNAGFGTHGLIWETDEKQTLELLQVNIVSLVHLTRLFVPGMVKRKFGRVLNVASLAAYLPGPYMASYYASKAFVLSYTEALDAELSGTGVTATALCPGPVATEFQKRAGVENSALFKNNSMDAVTCARIGYRAMMQGRRVVIPGFKSRMMALGTKFTPRRILTVVAKNLNKDR